jgi:hypothetical protein
MLQVAILATIEPTRQLKECIVCSVIRKRKAWFVAVWVIYPSIIINSWQKAQRESRKCHPPFRGLGSVQEVRGLSEKVSQQEMARGVRKEEQRDVTDPLPVSEEEKVVRKEDQFPEREKEKEKVNETQFVPFKRVRLREIFRRKTFGGSPRRNGFMSVTIGQRKSVLQTRSMTG